MIDFDNIDPIFKDTPIVEQWKLIQKSNVFANLETEIGIISKKYKIDHCLNNLIIVGGFLNLMSAGGYVNFNKIRKDITEPFKNEFDIIYRIITRNDKGFQYKIKSIRIDYIDGKGNPESETLNNKYFLPNIQMALYENFTQKFWDINRKRILKDSHKPYADGLKYWIKKLDKYLQDKIIKRKDRYFFIGEYLKVSGMPLVYLQDKREGQEIPEKNYFDHIRKSYL